MNPVGSLTSYQTAALTLLRIDTSLKAYSGQENTHSDPVSKAAPAPLQVLQATVPRSAPPLSIQTAEAIITLVHGGPHHTGSTGAPGGIDESAWLTDEAFAATRENTPARYAEMMQGLGAARWVLRPEVHLTGIDFFKALSEAIPRDYDNPNSMAQALFRDKVAKIVFATDAPDAKIVSAYYDMYNDKNEYIGTVRRTECDQAYLDGFKEDHPGLRIAPVYFGNDAVLVIWPDASAKEDGAELIKRLHWPNA